MTFSKKKFTILVAEDDNHGFKQEHTFIFNLIDEKACKHLWKCAVEYHAFFRLRTSPRQLMLLQSAGNGLGGGNGGLFNGFIRRGSRFRGPERTEYQTANMTRLTTPRRSVQFERRPSQRFSRRASYAIKRKLQEQQHNRAGNNLRASQMAPTSTAISSPNNVKVDIEPTTKPRSSQQSPQQNALVPSLSDTKINNKGRNSTSPVNNKTNSKVCFNLFYISKIQIVQ